MDFLLVGFVKAGTTSLDDILRQDKRILLPKHKKETHFFDWSGRKGALEFFWNTYYPETDRKRRVLKGGIEPCYSRSAKQVYEVFGKDVKLIFMMRNPLQADYSLFKMGLKWGGTRKLIHLYKGYSANQAAQMYHRYTEWRVNHPVQDDFIRDEFRYEKWIREYLKYFSLEQMKFILFEDFVKKPEAAVREVERFVGLYDRRLDCSARSNEGDAVSRNYLCAWVNYCLSHMKKPLEYRNVHLLRAIGKLQGRLFRITLTENKERMFHKTELILADYYKQTKAYVEELSGRNLSDVWF